MDVWSHFYRKGNWMRKWIWHWYTIVHNISRDTGCADAASSNYESGAIRSISSGYWSAAVTFKSTPVKIFTTTSFLRKRERKREFEISCVVIFGIKSYTTNDLHKFTNNVAISGPSSGYRSIGYVNVTRQFSYSCISFDLCISSSARTCTHLSVKCWQ